MLRSYSVDRLFSLGNYKNIKFNATVELDESDARPSVEVFEGLVDDVYEAFFQHDRRLKRLNAVPDEEREKAFFEGE